MFGRISKSTEFYQMRNEWIWELNEDNVLKMPVFKIRNLEKRYKKYERQFIEFKYLVLWRWVRANLTISEKFINCFKKVHKKLRITLSLKEEKFISDIEEAFFSSWRPLKQMVVKFDPKPKEVISLLQSNVILLSFNEKTKQSSQIGEYDIFYSNQRVIFCDKEQVVKFEIKNSDIKKVDALVIGVVINTGRKSFLLRANNRYLAYIFLENMIPRLQLDFLKNVDYLKPYGLSEFVLSFIN